MSLCVAAMEKPTGMIVKQNAQGLLTIQPALVNNYLSNLQYIFMEEITSNLRNIAVKLFATIFFLSIGISCNEEDGDCIRKINAACICANTDAPVCGCDGKTYRNSCVAYCSGITDYSEGACK